MGGAGDVGWGKVPVGDGQPVKAVVLGHEPLPNVTLVSPDCGQVASNGLRTEMPPRLSTWV